MRTPPEGRRLRPIRLRYDNPAHGSTRVGIDPRRDPGGEVRLPHLRYAEVSQAGPLVPLCRWRYIALQVGRAVWKRSADCP